ncbi:MAG: ATP-binding cassette domain-containing protein [Thermoanaerobaculia bacterium]
MISITNLGKAWGGDTLFEGVSLQLNAGSRYGLVGANGSGKSTFLRILSGEELASEGTVNIPAPPGSASSSRTISSTKRRRSSRWR